MLISSKYWPNIDNIISTNKSWKLFKQTKKCNQTNTVSFVSGQKNHQKLYNKLIKSLETHIVDNKLVMSTESKSFRFDLPKLLTINLTKKFILS